MFSSFALWNCEFSVVTTLSPTFPLYSSPSSNLLTTLPVSRFLPLGTGHQTCFPQLPPFPPRILPLP